MQKTLIKLSRKFKVFLMIVFDLTLLTVALVFAYIRDSGSISQAMVDISWLTLFFGLPFCIWILHFLGIYSALIRFTVAKTLVEVLLGCGLSALILWMFSFVVGQSFPWVLAVDFALVSGVFLTGGRLLLRTYFRTSQTSSRKPTIIYGASDFGSRLLTSIQQGNELNPIAFMDNTEELVGSIIGGVKVYSPDYLEDLVVNKNVTVILLTTKGVSLNFQKKLKKLLKSRQIEVQQIPAVYDILSGQAKITDFRQVAIEDLLRREPVQADLELMREKTFGKSVLVTGAGGSIGSEICQQVLNSEPKTIVLVEQSEYALYAIEQELNQKLVKQGRSVILTPILGSICDQKFMEEVLSRFDVDTVFHAAAFKHVPLLEGNIITAIENNVFGTEEMIVASIASGVSSFTMISTDKAVRPTNVMGASKRLAELVCQAYADCQEDMTISIVRFGNVLGSSGSVIPLFSDQIENGGPVTVTHKEMTRYFMTIPEAAELVIQSSGMAIGGDIFILDMGEPIKIVDLAQSMIRLAGFKPFISQGEERDGTLSDEKIEIIFTGIRPGEKLYEELLIDTSSTTSIHPRIGRAREKMLKFDELNIALTELKSCVKKRNSYQLVEILKKLPLEYFQQEPPKGP